MQLFMQPTTLLSLLPQNFGNVGRLTLARPDDMRMAKCVRWLQEQVVALLLTCSVLHPWVAQRPCRLSVSYSQKAHLVTSAAASTGCRREKNSTECLAVYGQWRDASPALRGTWGEARFEPRRSHEHAGWRGSKDQFDWCRWLELWRDGTWRKNRNNVLTHFLFVPPKLSCWSLGTALSHFSFMTWL